MKTLRILLLLVVAMFLADSAAAAGIDGKRACVAVTSSTGSETLVDGLAMTSSRTITYDGDNKAGGYDLLVVWLQLTDANTSITSFTTTCTVSRDGNTTDYIPQKDAPSGSGWTQTDANVFTKANPGTKKWPIRMNMNGYPDFKCVFAGAGAPAAPDVLTAHARLCTSGG